MKKATRSEIKRKKPEKCRHRGKVLLKRDNFFVMCDNFRNEVATNHGLMMICAFIMSFLIEKLFIFNGKIDFKLKTIQQLGFLKILNTLEIEFS